MAYNVRYRVDAIEARTDGSGMVEHDIWAEAALEGTEEWQTVPGNHKGILVPYDEVQAALGAGTAQQIVAAYKNALVANLNTPAAPIVGWTAEQISAKMEANALAAAAREAVLTFLPSGLPVRFTL